MGNRLLRVMIVWIAMLVISLPLNSFAEESANAKSEEQKEQKVEVKKEQDMSNWWTRNPLTFDPMPEKFLWHFESTYQYDRSTGNWTTDNHLLNSQLSLRYNRFTNHIRYNFDKRNVAKPTAPPNSDENTDLRKSTMHEIHEDFRYAITKRLYAAPGVFYFQDDYSYIDERWTYYLGLGADLITHPLFKLSVFGAYGYETLRYIDEYHETYNIVKDWGIDESIKGYDPGTEEGDVAYLTETIRLFPYYGIMVTQELIYVADVSDTDIYRWTFKIGVDFKIMEHLFVSTEYKEEYDNDANELLGVRKRDQTTGIGIKVVF
ncbi:MAG: DUF481 domain-containing protein [Desulfamplus sp.]|nr:DUF481 domain-containing protein [Desulfamplus sp.]MBF0411463.1 DUF481 domain-containing protein [Desulfamplus sp.]